MRYLLLVVEVGTESATQNPCLGAFLALGCLLNPCEEFVIDAGLEFVSEIRPAPSHTVPL